MGLLPARADETGAGDVRSSPLVATARRLHFPRFGVEANPGAGVEDPQPRLMQVLVEPRCQLDWLLLGQGRLGIRPGCAEGAVQLEETRDDPPGHGEVEPQRLQAVPFSRRHRGVSLVEPERHPDRDGIMEGEMGELVAEDHDRVAAIGTDHDGAGAGNGESRTPRGHRRVEVVISLGEEFASVPELFGESVRGARVLLERSGLRAAGLTHAPSDQVGEGLVVATDPPAETVLRRGAPVGLLVSSGSGPQFYVMPDLLGREITGAMRQLDVLGFKISVPPGSPPMGTIVMQLPAPGSRIAPGDAITLQATRRIIR